MYWVLVMITTSAGTTLYSLDNTPKGVLEFSDLETCEYVRVRLPMPQDWHCAQASINVPEIRSEHQ